MVSRIHFLNQQIKWIIIKENDFFLNIACQKKQQNFFRKSKCSRSWKMMKMQEKTQFVLLYLLK